MKHEKISPRPASVANAATVSSAAISFPAVTPFQLQTTTVKPASTPGTMPVVQRNDEWAFGSTTAKRQGIDETREGQRFRFVEDHGPKAGFGTSLHHHVSREAMSAIADNYKGSQRKASKMKKGGAKDELIAGLAAFQRAVDRIAASAGLEDTSNFEKVLHNLPLNLHYGPSIVKDNPGSGFDPSTEPVPDTDGERRLEPTSEALLSFYNTYRQGFEESEDGSLSPEKWQQLAECLLAAQAAYENATNLVNGIAVNMEQWVGTPGSDTYAKKGLKQWPGLETARQRFQERTGPLAGGGPGLSAHHDFTLAYHGGYQQRIRIGYSVQSLEHFCNRHTYRYFDKAQIKLQNTFFRPGTDQGGMVQQAAAAMAAVEAEISRLNTEGTDWVETLGDDGHTFTHNNMTICILYRDDQWGDGNIDDAIDIVMMVPEGAGYESYDYATLTALNLP